MASKCANCHKTVELVRSSVKDGEYLKNYCDPCLASFNGFSDGSRRFFRDWDRREHAKSLVQPWETDFISAYPDKAKEAGWSDEAIRKYG